MTAPTTTPTDHRVDEVALPSGGRLAVLVTRLGDGVRAAFTGAATGTLPIGVPGNQSHRRPHRPSDLAAARSVATALVEAEPTELVLLEQVHGAHVRQLDEPSTGMRELPACDAVVTSLSGPALGVLTADCVPLLLATDDRVGVAHAGREGLRAGVVEAVLDRLPGRGRAVIGPAVRGCCYEVPEAMQEAVATTHPAARATTSWGTPSLDLPAAVVRLLLDRDWDVSDTGLCTHHDERFMSHRRDAGTGRQLALVRRVPT